MRTPAAWVRRLKRREPGIYAYRTRQHLAPWKTEWGYIGKSRHLAMRDNCHGGICTLHGCQEKPWWDLKVRRYAFELPWWLGFDFITLSLETLAILVLRPRYNWQKNPRRDKAGPRTQAAERLTRSSMPDTYRALVRRTQIMNYAFRITGLLLILVGFGGWLWHTQ